MIPQESLPWITNVSASEVLQRLHFKHNPASNATPTAGPVELGTENYALLVETPASRIEHSNTVNVFVNQVLEMFHINMIVKVYMFPLHFNFFLTSH